MADDAALQNLLAPIRERNRPRLLERLGRVREAIDSGDPADPAGAAPEQLHSDLHALIGALGTYGWPEGSELMTQIRDSLSEGRGARHLLAELDRLATRIGAAA